MPPIASWRRQSRSPVTRMISSRRCAHPSPISARDPLIVRGSRLLEEWPMCGLHPAQHMSRSLLVSDRSRRPSTHEKSLSRVRTMRAHIASRSLSCMTSPHFPRCLTRHETVAGSETPRLLPLPYILSPHPPRASSRFRNDDAGESVGRHRKSSDF